MIRRTRAMAAELHAGVTYDAGNSPVELRRHVRVEMPLEVSFSFSGDFTRPPARGVTRDISHGGACIAVIGLSDQLLEKLADMLLLDIRIDVPRASSDQQTGAALSPVQGRVEWMRLPAAPGAPTLIGLEFRNLDATAETAMIDLIAHLLLGNGI